MWPWTRLWLILLLTLGWGARAAEGGPAGPSVEVLCRHWVHSAEEDKAGGKEQVYRPADSRPFPPRRFRMQYRLAKNGDCEWFSLSPNDAHRFKPGRWSLDRQDRNVLRIVQGERTVSFRVLEATPDILRLQPVEARSGR